MSFNCSCSTRNPSWPNGESISWYALPGIMACRLRISLGLENADDLIEDFEQAFAQIG